MAGNLRISLEIGADGKAAIREVKGVNRELGNLDSGAKSAKRGVGDFDRSVRGLTGSLRTLLPALSVGAVISFSRSIAESADSIKLLQAQASHLGGDFDSLYASAQRIGVGLKDAGDASNLLTPAFQKLGKSYQDTLKFNEDLVNSLRLYGGSGAQAASVTTQLAQALGSGNLAGDELKSLRENAGGLAQALEEAIQKSLGTTESIKDLGSEGALTSKVVADAFEKVFEQLRGDFKSLPDLLSQQESRMSNAANRMFAAFDEALYNSAVWKYFYKGLIDQIDKITFALSGVPLADHFKTIEDRAKAVREEIARVTKELEGYKEQQANVITIPFVQGLGLDKLLSTPIQQSEERLKKLNEELAKLENQSKGAASGLTGLGGAASATSGEVERIATVTNSSIEGVSKHLSTIYKFADLYEVPRALAVAVAGVESSFNEAAKSPTGPVGLFQMSKAAAIDASKSLKAFGITAEQIQIDPDKNIQGGIRFLADKIIEAGGDVDKALKRYGDGTQAYSDKVIGVAKQVAIALSDEKTAAKLGKEQLDALNESKKSSAKNAIIAAQSEEEFNRQLRGVVETANPAIKDVRELAETHALLARAVDAGKLSQKQADEIYQQHVHLMVAAVEHTGEFGNETKKATTEVDLFGKALEQTVQSAVGSIQGDLSDSFYAFFTGTLDESKSFVDRLEETLLRGIANIAAQIASQAIVVPIVGAVTGGVLGSTGTTTGTTSGVSGSTGSGSLVGSVSSLTNVISKNNSIGTFLGTSLTKAAGTFGAAGETTAAAASNLASTSNLYFGAGSIIGGLAGSWLFDSSEADIGSSIGSAAGSAIGSAILPGIGTVIGGVLGGVAGGAIGNLFGGSTPKTGFVTTGTNRARVSFDDAGHLSSSQYSSFQDTVNQVNDALENIYQYLDPGAVEQVRQQSNRGANPRYVQNAEDAIATSITSLFEQLAAAGGETEQAVLDAVRANKGSIEGELNAAMEAVNQYASEVAATEQNIAAIPALRTAIERSGVTFGDAEDNWLSLMGALGGAGTATAAVNQYLKDFSDDSTKFQYALEDIGSAFDALGVALPNSREDFVALVESIDTTTDSGRELFASLVGMSSTMKALYDEQERLQEATGETTVDIGELAQAVSVLSDSAQSFIESIAPVGTIEELTARFTEQFVAWGLSLPETTEALYALYQAGALTNEQIEILATESNDLLRLYELTGQAQKEAAQSIADFVDSLRPVATVEEQWAQFSSLFESWGFNVVPATREALLALYEAGLLSTEQLSSLAAQTPEVAQMYDALEAQAKEAAQAALQAQQDAANATYQSQVDAANAAYQAQVDDLDLQREAAQDWVNDINGILSTLGSAISSFSPSVDEVVSLEFERAKRQLTAMVASSGIPDEATLQAVTGSLVAGKDSALYGSAQEQATAEAIIRAQLQELERRGEGQLSTAEQQLDYLEKQYDAISEWRDRSLAQAEDWRDQEIERLDAMAAALESGGQVSSAYTAEPIVVGAESAASQGAQTVAATQQSTAEIIELRTKLTDLAAQQLEVQKSLKTFLSRWESAGIPLRDDEDGQPIYILRTQ